ncbi:hypothetical protein D3C80_1454480 [compost metagenome]
MVAAVGAVGFSTISTKARIAVTNVKRPAPTKDVRQPSHSVRTARGVVASRAPRPPDDINSPVTSAKSLPWNHSENSFIAGTKSIAIPAPTRNLPSAATSIDSAKPKSTEPNAAMAKKVPMVRFAPHLSASTPAGICISAWG